MEQEEKKEYLYNDNLTDNENLVNKFLEVLKDNDIDIKICKYQDDVLIVDTKKDIITRVYPSHSFLNKYKTINK